MEVLVRGLEPGQKYVLQVRSVSSDAVSPWSNTFRLETESDTTPPSPVTNLTWVPNGSSFVATWTKPTTDAKGNSLRDFDQYVVTLTANGISRSYVVGQERFDFSFDQNVGLFGSPQPTVEIAVQARDTTGNLSTSVQKSATNPIPADVQGFTATGIPNAISLKWDETVESDFKVYEVYSSTTQGFTPSESNLVTRTTSTSFVYPTSVQVVHYFKVRQVDLFDQGSANYAEASATPELSTGLDTSPPDAPTNVAVTTDVDTDGFSKITVSWDAVTSQNLGGYSVRYSTDEVSWQYVDVPSDQESVVLDRLDPATDYYVSAASVSYVSSYSAWVNAATYPIRSAVDTTAPSQPSAPSVSIGTTRVQIVHDLTKLAGGSLETDTDYLEVHGSTAPNFSISNTTLFTTIPVPSVSISVSGLVSYTPENTDSEMYWAVVAVDRTGNKSVKSPETTGLPGLIEGANIAEATITDANIQNLSAAKIQAGTAFINDLSVESSFTVGTGGLIQSENFSMANRTGYQLTQDKLIIFDGDIEAGSIKLQDSVMNLIPAVYADFEFHADYYGDTGDNPNPDYITTSGVNPKMRQILGGRYGRYCARMYTASSLTYPSKDTYTFATTGLVIDNNGFDGDPGDYILSFWAMKNGSGDQELSFGLYTNTGESVKTDPIVVSATEWTRYYGIVTVPSGTTRMKAFIEIGPSTGSGVYDILIDGLQVERKISASDEPSPWRPPLSTTIDGGSIITGSIRSSAPAIGNPDQPAWSLNAEGGLQVGDALVRGRLDVGHELDTSDNLMPIDYSGFYNPDTSFYFDSSGNLNTTNYSLVLDPDTQTSTYTFSIDTHSDQYHASPNPHLKMVSSDHQPGGSVFFCLTPDGFLESGNNINQIPGTRYEFFFEFTNSGSNVVEMAIMKMDGSSVFVLDPWWDVDPGEVNKYKLTYTANSANCQFAIGIRPKSSVGFTVEIANIYFREYSAPKPQWPDWVSPNPQSWRSHVGSSNFSSGSQGWRIYGDGSAELNNAYLRGAWKVDGSTGSIETNLEGKYPGLRFYHTDAETNWSELRLVDNASRPGNNPSMQILSGTYSSPSYGSGVRSRLWLADGVIEMRIKPNDNENIMNGGVLIVGESSSEIYTVGKSDQASMKARFSAGMNTAYMAYGYGVTSKGGDGKADSSITVSQNSISLQNNGRSNPDRIRMSSTKAMEVWPGSSSRQVALTMYSDYPFIGLECDMNGNGTNEFVGWYGFAYSTLWRVTSDGFGTYRDPGYMMLPDGTVMMRGRLDSTYDDRQTVNGANNPNYQPTPPPATVGTLDPFVRPSNPIVVPFSVGVSGGAISGQNPRILIEVNGRVSVYGVNLSHRGLQISLEGVSFNIWDRQP